jgi:hypothetical protein
MDNGRSSTRRLRIFLRDFRMVEATVYLAEGQALAPYFSHRKSYVNLREARWVGTDDHVTHAVLKVEQVLWAASPEGEVPLINASAAGRQREIEMQLDGGLLLQGAIVMSAQQRLSDYLEHAGHFVPVMNARLLRSGRPPRTVNMDLGDIVLNQAGIQSVWELAEQNRARPAPEGPAERDKPHTEETTAGD